MRDRFKITLCWQWEWFTYYIYTHTILNNWLNVDFLKTFPGVKLQICSSCHPHLAHATFMYAEGICCRFLILKRNHSALYQYCTFCNTQTRIKNSLLFIYLMSKFYSYLYWSEPVGANPGPHLSLYSLCHWVDPLQLKRLMLDQGNRQRTSWLTLISCWRETMSRTVATTSGC